MKYDDYWEDIFDHRKRVRISPNIPTEQELSDILEEFRNAASNSCESEPTEHIQMTYEEEKHECERNTLESIIMSALCDSLLLRQFTFKRYATPARNMLDEINKGDLISCYFNDNGRFQEIKDINIAEVLTISEIVVDIVAKHFPNYDLKAFAQSCESGEMDRIYEEEIRPVLHLD